MSECICSSCKNLKSSVNESNIDELEKDDNDKNGIAEEYECEYGFPSESCSECEVDGCDLTCEHYINDRQEELVISECKRCGKELKLMSRNDEEGAVYCVTCYLDTLK